MVEETEEDDLDPCPFAHDGTEVFVDTPPPGWEYYVECGECGCRGPLRATKAEAVAAWNSRP